MVVFEGTVRMAKSLLNSYLALLMFFVLTIVCLNVWQFSVRGMCIFPLCNVRSFAPVCDNDCRRLQLANTTCGKECLKLQKSKSSIHKDCDKECQKLHNLFSNSWPSNKPKAIFYYLTTGYRYDAFLKSLELLYVNFNKEFRYPVVVFYEDVDSTFDVDKIRSASKHLTFFQKLRFTMPSFIDERRVPKRVCKAGIGYRHMCRFQAYSVYKHPIMFSTLQYLWRLDDDSFIKQNISYDLFQFMRDKDLTYGYVHYLRETRCNEGLYEDVDVYIHNMSIKPTFYHKIRSKPHYVYYNNFEISKHAFWQSNDYQNYINYIDRRGGMYYWRWGDATIKSIAVSLFLNTSDMHHFTDVRYQHQKIFV